MLLLANLGAQSITLAVSPILTRVYSPDDFGLLGLFSSLILILTPLATGRFELAIPGSDNASASDIVTLSLITILIGCILTAAVTAVGVQAFSFSWLMPLKRYWGFLPFGLFLAAAYDVSVMEASRRNDLFPLAASRLTQATVGAATQILFGIMGWGPIGLLMGFILNQSAGMSRMIRSFGGLRQYWPKKSARAYLSIAYANRQLPFYSSWSDALTAAARWGTQIAITIWWDPAIGGYMFLADRVVGRPLMVLSSSTLPVFYAEVSRALGRRDHEQITHVFNRMIVRQAYVAGAWTVAVIALAPLCIEFMFGVGWTNAVSYVQVLSIAIAPGAIMHTVAHTPKLLGQGRIDAYWVVVRVAVTATAVWLCHRYHQSALSTLAIFALLQVIFGVLTFWIYKKCVALYRSINS